MMIGRRIAAAIQSLALRFPFGLAFLRYLPLNVRCWEDMEHTIVGETHPSKACNKYMEWDGTEAGEIVCAPLLLYNAGGSAATNEARVDRCAAC